MDIIMHVLTLLQKALYLFSTRIYVQMYCFSMPMGACTRRVHTYLTCFLRTYVYTGIHSGRFFVMKNLSKFQVYARGGCYAIFYLPPNTTYLIHSY